MGLFNVGGANLAPVALMTMGNALEQGQMSGFSAGAGRALGAYQAETMRDYDLGRVNALQTTANSKIPVAQIAAGARRYVADDGVTKYMVGQTGQVYKELGDGTATQVGADEAMNAMQGIVQGRYQQIGADGMPVPGGGQSGSSAPPAASPTIAGTLAGNAPAGPTTAPGAPVGPSPGAPAGAAPPATISSTLAGGPPAGQVSASIPGALPPGVGLVGTPQGGMTPAFNPSSGPGPAPSMAATLAAGVAPVSTVPAPIAAPPPMIASPPTASGGGSAPPTLASTLNIPPSAVGTPNQYVGPAIGAKIDNTVAGTNLKNAQVGLTQAQMQDINGVLPVLSKFGNVPQNEQAFTVSTFNQQNGTNYPVPDGKTVPFYGPNLQDNAKAALMWAQNKQATAAAGLATAQTQQVPLNGASTRALQTNEGAADIANANAHGVDANAAATTAGANVVRAGNNTAQTQYNINAPYPGATAQGAQSSAQINNLNTNLQAANTQWTKLQQAFRVATDPNVKAGLQQSMDAVQANIQVMSKQRDALVQSRQQPAPGSMQNTLNNPPPGTAPYAVTATAKLKNAPPLPYVQGGPAPAGQSPNYAKLTPAQRAQLLIQQAH